MIHYTPDQIEQQTRQMQALGLFFLCLVIIYFLLPKTKTMLKVKATFKGADGSLQFLKNIEYSFTIYSSDTDMITIFCDALKQRCEYSNVITFLENWKNVTAQ